MVCLTGPAWHAHGQIIADKTAPSTQQPTIFSAPNGVPLVNIQTPSAAGVSRNSYSQFDVPRQGAILNNAPANTQTQLGGWIQGNPWVAGGSARVILNEVNASNPSLLNGYTEVAGNRAEVVIANPAGIRCHGCGFINAYRATLSTGAPVINGDHLDGYRVKGGSIVIDEWGLDTATTDYTDLIARSVIVNAGIWANAGKQGKQLRISTGLNWVNADHTVITPLNRVSDDAGSGAGIDAGNSETKPLFAIDVAKFGGMYAGKIILVGTESGVGMRNGGHIGASAGEASITQQGQLINNGIINSAADLQIRAGDGIINTGALVSQGAMLLAAAEGAIVNASANIFATGSLELSAKGITNAGGFLSGSRVNIDSQGKSLNNAGGTLYAHGAADANADTGNLRIDSGDLNNDAGLLLANGTITIDTHGNKLGNTHSGKDQGIIGSQGVWLSTGSVDNRQGYIGSDGSVHVQAQSINNTQGMISSGDTLDLQDTEAVNKTLSITNTDGTLLAGKQLSIDSLSLTGDGKLLSEGDLHIRLRSDFVHTGRVQANGQAVIETTGQLDNRADMIGGAGLVVQAAGIDNAATGNLQGGNVDLSAAPGHALTNRGIIDGQTVHLTSTTLNNIGTGRIYGDRVAISAGTLNNREEAGKAAVIAARNRLDIGAESIDNREGATLFSAGDMAIGGRLDPRFKASGKARVINNASATIEALGNMRLSAVNVNNTNQHLTTELALTETLPNQRDNVSSTYYRIYTRRIYTPQIVTSAPAKILAGGDLTLDTESALNDSSQIIVGGDIDIVGQSLIHRGAERQGRIDDSGTAYTLVHIPSSGLCGFIKINCVRAHDEWRPAAYRNTSYFTDVIGIGEAQSHTVAASSGIQAAPLAAHTIIRVTPLAAQAPDAPKVEVRTGGVNASLPVSSLFKLSMQADSHYLIETDPRYADYRTWLSSDYLLRAMDADPATTQKRLGDGFYEQKLIREQVAQLTGRRFLDNFASDEAQFQYLMDNAASFARAYSLRPGIALTDAQMAALTSDIVWLVETELVQSDGSKVKVLVPQLYVRVREGDLTGDGALLAGGNVQMQLTGDLNNQGGVIAGRRIVNLQAGNINNLNARITGDGVLAQAGNDLNNVGGSIDASRTLIATAGRDLNVVTTTQTSATTTGRNTYGRTTTDRVAGLYVTGKHTGEGGQLLAVAGRDIHLAGADIVNQQDGSTVIAAARNLNLDTVTTGETTDIYWDRHNTLKETRKAEVGSRVQAQGDLHLTAGQDIRTRAADVSSTQGALQLDAGRNIALQSGESIILVDEAHKVTAHGMFSSTTLTTHDTLDQQIRQGSTLSGDTVNLQAGQDLLVQGSNVVSTNGTRLLALGEIAIEADHNRSDETHFRHQKDSGLMSSGGFGITIGTRKQSTDEQLSSTRAVASTVGSIAGDVSIRAGQDYTQTGSDLIAPQGKMEIDAQRVDIREARNTDTRNAATQFKQSGVTVAITSPVIAAVQTAQQMSQAASHVKDSRMQALAAASTAMAVNTAVNAVQAGQGSTINGVANQIPTGKDASGNVTSRDATTADKLGGYTVSVSVGTSSRNSHTTQTSDTASDSHLIAGQDVRIRATGAGTHSDLTIQGSQVKAGQGVQLQADNAIKLLAAQNAIKQHSDNQSSSASIGVAISSNAGTGITLSGSGGRGKADGNDLSWSNTHISGQQVALDSGSDTRLEGAVVSAEQISAQTGGHLIIASPQDSSSYQSKQREVSGGIVVGSGFSGNIAFNNSDINSSYTSVIEQSGLRAGDGGFDVTVKGDTRLKGGVITSTQTAVDQQRNQFQTDGTLETSDLQNTARYKASASGVNFGSGIDPQGKLAPPGTSGGIGRDGDQQRSVTLAAISGVAGKQGARTDDAEAGLARTFDAEAVQREINAQVQITQSFSAQAHKIVEDYIRKPRVELKKLADKEEDKEVKAAMQARLNELKLEERVFNVLIGAVTGLAGTAVAKESLASAAEEMRELMKANSNVFKGITDGKTVLTNNSGVSVGANGDGIKLGGTRVDLDLFCKPDNSYCETNPDGSLKLDEQGYVKFVPQAAKTPSLLTYLESAEAKDIPGLAGGIQGAKGSLFGVPYESGSWQDKLVEAFSGSHDMIGGQLSGLYDAQGNARRGRSKLEVALYNRWSEIAIPLSAPFAAASALSPDAWQAIAIFLKGAQ